MVARAPSETQATPAGPRDEARDAPGTLSAPVVAGIAHDLKNLLTVIAQGCEWTLTHGATDADGRAQLASVQATAERAARLAAHLMRLARGDAGTQPLALDIEAALAGLRAPLAAVLGPDIGLDVRTACAGARVDIDPLAFERVLFNLAGNARQAMPAGGRLAIVAEACAGAWLPVGAAAGEDAGRWLGIAVSDSGEGIADAVRESLFETGVTTRQDAGGHGLGLATVRAIVEGAGGRIAAENAPGGGACFRIALPVVDAPSAAVGEEEAAARQMSAPAAGCGEGAGQGPGEGAGAILLVEDEDAVRGLAARVLSGSGYRVIEAASAEDALAEIERAEIERAEIERAEITRAEVAAWHNGIDLLIADLMLPGMDGRALAAEIRRRRAGLPVILVSGYADGDAGDGKVVGDGVRFLEKPFSLADLLAAVSGALAGG